MAPATEIVTLAAGCFWGVESAFRRLSGVLSTTVGYSGGATPNPTYEQVCTGTTHHAEVVRITFDPDTISCETLLTTFWRIHDPTTLNRQGPDIGSQYRSAIFFHTPAQEDTARRSKAAASPHFPRPIVTEITAAGVFYPAEEYHQQYEEKRRSIFTGGLLRRLRNRSPAGARTP